MMSNQVRRRIVGCLTLVFAVAALYLPEVEGHAAAPVMSSPSKERNNGHPPASYLIGTWKIVDKTKMSTEAISPSIAKLDQEQIGKEISFTTNSITFNPPFLDLGIKVHCRHDPVYAVSQIDLYGKNGNAVSGVVISSEWLQWWHMAPPWVPYGKESATVFTASCDDGLSQTGLDEVFRGQLTKSGDLAVSIDGGFFLLRKESGARPPKSGK